MTCTVPDINNAVPNVDVGDSIDYGNSVTYTCNEGFANNDGGQTILTCGSNGELEGSPPDCQGT